MKVPALFLAFVFSATSASASAIHHANELGLAARHISLARRATTSLETEKKNTVNRKRCRPRSLESTSSRAASTSTSSPSPTPKPSTSAVQNVAKTSPTPTPQPQENNNNGGGNWGILDKSGPCGWSRASEQITALSGPNGHIDWLNCGVDGGGWNPPFIHVNEVKVKPLHNALSDPASPFQACGAFIWIFEKYGNEFGVPPIILASFAMQESSCNPHTVGGGGEQGLMQITHDKCGGAPGGNCQDPEFNIRTGAKYFADTLNANGGNLLVAMGQYNGWRIGLTIGSATAARWSACCRCQNNLDYLHQMVNGWFQNRNAYSAQLRLGKYFNLDPCN